MGIFAKMDLSEVKIMGKGNYFTPGEYLVEVLNTKSNQGGYKGDSIILEFEVLGSEGEEAAPAGEHRDHVLIIGGADKQRSDSGLGDFMAFLCVCFGVDSPKSLSKEEWDELATSVIQDNALKGEVLRLSCFMTKTKKEKDFTVHKYLRLATEEDIARFIPAE